MTFWALQVQFLLQIIINRILVIMGHDHRTRWMKWGVAALITAVNISVYCIWIPARLQISDKFVPKKSQLPRDLPCWPWCRYVHINDAWDRTEKVIYLVVDAILNWYFVRTVKQRLVKNGSVKYNQLVKFNVRIICLSLMMDVSTSSGEFCRIELCLTEDAALDHWNNEFEKQLCVSSMSPQLGIYKTRTLH